MNKILEFLKNLEVYVTWYSPTNCSLSCLTLILILDGVNDSVSFVDNIITVEAAVVRDRDIPLEHLLVSVCVNIHTSVTEMYPLLLSTENTRTKNHHAMSSRIPRKKNDTIHEFEINDIDIHIALIMVRCVLTSC